MIETTEFPHKMSSIPQDDHHTLVQLFQKWRCSWQIWCCLVIVHSFLRCRCWQPFWPDVNTKTISILLVDSKNYWSVMNWLFGLSFLLWCFTEIHCGIVPGNWHHSCTVHSRYMHVGCAWTRIIIIINVYMLMCNSTDSQPRCQLQSTACPQCNSLRIFMHEHVNT